MRAVVVAHGALAADDAWMTAILDQADLIVAADGGAVAVWALGRCPHLVVGDLDSFDPALRAAMEARGCGFQIHPREKEQTDAELALMVAAERGADSIVVLGALGGARLDHALANVLLLAMPELAGRDVCLADPRHEVRLLRGPTQLTIAGEVGDLVTLLPLTGTASGITTDGLLYGLRGATLNLGRGRGVSNELTGEQATAEVREGLLLVVLEKRGARQRSGRPRGGASRRRR